MLTADLVQARVYKGEVRPRYIDAEDPEKLAVAEALIEAFRASEGRPRHELDGELKELLGTGTDFLFHRALAKLLFDRSRFDTEAEDDPETVRRAVFEAAAETYLRPHREDDKHPFNFDRAAVLEAVAGPLEIERAALERGLYADLKDEQVLVEWKPCRPRWLLERYNVALAQGVLLRASELTVKVGAQPVRRQRELFRKIKFFQLLHRVESDGEGGYTIRLDGPMSLFKASGKYGVKMASFLPTLLHFDRWSLTASLLWGPRRRKLRFRLSPKQGLKPYTRLLGQWQPEELAWLPEQFDKLGSQWEISTDAELIALGGQGVLVPDFVFRHPPSGTRVFVEVLGFWGRGVVESRLELLRRHGPENFILALSKQLAAGREGLDEIPGEVYVFRATPIARKVLKVLEERFGC
jgi:predicted nuclease of restriction endonuclease-like RecB superfamily